MEPSALPAPTSVCNSSMKRTTPPSAASISCSTALSRSLAPVFRAGYERAHVERQQLLVAQALGHVAVHDCSARPSAMAVLPTPGSPMSTGLFLVRRDSTCIVRQFLVAPDHRIELPLRCRVGQVAGVALERVVGLLGRCAVGGTALAQIVDRGIEPNRRYAAWREFSRFRLPSPSQAQVEAARR